MTHEILALIVSHFACANLAAERPLTVGEAEFCGTVYQEVKLAFVPDIDRQAFGELSPAERHQVNLAGYRAFYDWQQSAPDRVAFLERVARGEAKLGRPS